jgi:hypothetical protein
MAHNPVFVVIDVWSKDLLVEVVRRQHPRIHSRCRCCQEHEVLFAFLHGDTLLLDLYLLFFASWIVSLTSRRPSCRG